MYETWLPSLSAVALLLIVSASAVDPTARIWGLGSLVLGLVPALGIAVAQRTRRLLAGEMVLLGTPLVLLGLATVDKPLKGVTGPLTLYLPTITPPPDLMVSANTMAYLLAPAVCVSLALALSSRAIAARYLWTTFFLIDLALVVLSGSRSSLVGTIAGAAILGLLMVRRLTLRMMTVALVAALFAIFVADIAIGLDLGDRVAIWRYALSQPANAVIGLGFGGFAVAAGRAAAQLPADGVPLNAHDLYLQTFLDFGGIGLIVLLAGLMTTIATCARHFRHDCRRGRIFAAMSLSCAVCLLVSGVGESVWSSGFAVAGTVVTVISPFPIWIVAGGVHVRCEAADARAP